MRRPRRAAGTLKVPREGWQAGTAAEARYTARVPRLILHRVGRRRRPILAGEGCQGNGSPPSAHTPPAPRPLADLEPPPGPGLKKGIGERRGGFGRREDKGARVSARGARISGHVLLQLGLSQLSISGRLLRKVSAEVAGRYSGGCTQEQIHHRPPAFPGSRWDSDRCDPAVSAGLQPSPRSWEPGPGGPGAGVDWEPLGRPDATPDPFHFARATSTKE